MIPLTVAAVLALPVARPVLAASSVGEALSLLAQMKKTADRCGFLSAAQRDEMGTFLARAEVIAANRVGAVATRRAISHGKRAGATAACTEDQAALVREAYAAAREALHASARPAPRRHVNERRVARQKPKATARRTAVGRIAATDKNVTRREQGDAVRRYVGLTSRYYRALRCGGVPHARMRAMYRQVKARHYALIRSHGGKVTARAKARARAIGTRGGCRIALN
ncbi:MAG TPA: hypothetical protein ENK15_05930 [Thermopetrobacter sp.]|nr:hypothetical protein [Thermopetrobacter sp.]